MKSNYTSISNTKSNITPCFNPNKSLSNSSFFNNTFKKQNVNINSSVNSQMYLKKSSSLGKPFIHKKNNSETIFTSTSKHINSKKLASSQYVKSSIKTDYSLNHNLTSLNIQNYNYLKKNQTNSFTSDGKFSNALASLDNNKEIVKPKDRIITELKANYSQDKLRRRKILTVNTNLDDNIVSFIEGKDNNPMNKSTNNVFNDKKEQPYRLYAGTESNQNDTESNMSYIKSTEQNKKINSSFVKSIDQSSIKKEINSFNISTQSRINHLFNELEIQMDKELKDNIANSKSKKYNTLKHFFESSIKTLSKTTNSRLFQKLLFGYHDVVSNFSVENRELKEGNSLLTNKLDKANQTIAEYEMKNQSLQNEIMQLRNRIIELERVHEQVISKSTENSTQIQESCGTENDNISLINNAQHNKVININKKNLGDLDALYFLDKVKINRTSSFSNSRNIPLLNLK